MKNIKYFIVFLITVFSCNIDRFPYDSIAADDLLSTDSGLESATLGNYALLKGDADGNGFAPQLHRITEYAGDNCALSGNTTDPLFYSYNYNNLKTSGRVNNFWESGYRAIVGCNKIIELSTEGKSADVDQLIGENYYLRAYAFFELVNVFGRPYTQGVSNLGIPLKLTTDVNDLPARSTVGEVYDQIIKDLLKSESLMTKEKTNSYATKEAAQALLSRVYLYMNKNDESINYANKVINSGRFSLLATENLPNYTKLNPDNNTETIFCLKYLENSDYNHGWYTVGSLYANILGVGWGEMYASSRYLDLLRMEPTDVRMKFIEPQYLLDANGNKIPTVYWISDNYKYEFRPTVIKNGKTYFNNNNVEYEVMSEQSGNQTKYYFTENGKKIYLIKDYDMLKRSGYPKFYILKCSLQENVPQLWSPVVSRLAELYLNKAEAYAKLGDTQNALDNVNIIRERAGIPKYNTIADLPAGYNLLTAVLLERHLELAYEGHRKFDVFRNNLTMDRRFPGTHLNGNNPHYEIDASDNRVIEYIPEQQITAQPSLIQNK